MPVIRVLGVPCDTSKDKLIALRAAIKGRIVENREMQLKRSQISVFLEKDFADDQNDVVAFIDLFNNNERTPKFKKRMAGIVGDLLVESFPEISFSEVLPKGYNDQEEGYWCWRKE